MDTDPLFDWGIFNFTVSKLSLKFLFSVFFKSSFKKYRIFHTGGEYQATALPVMSLVSVKKSKKDFKTFKVQLRTVRAIENNTF